MRFSFCLIARNEAKTLPRLLESLSAFKAAGGEVCLLDTGSTDDTVKIAREWGCKVEEAGDIYRHTITKEEAHAINEKFVVGYEKAVILPDDSYFNFGNARNHAASLSSLDIVSFVDADEVLVKLDFEAINALIERGFNQFEYDFVFAHDEQGRPGIEFVQSKFYDRTKMHWNGIIHEVLAGEGNRTFLPKAIFGLEHWQNPETNRGGYLKGLAVDCFNNPDSDRNSHYFAREMMYLDRPQSAIQEFQRHVDMNRWQAEKAQSLIYMGDCYGKLDMSNEQQNCYSEAFYASPEKREALLRLAQFYKHKKNPKAVAAFTAAAMEIPWNGFYADSKADYQHIPHELMYWAKGWLGDIPAARYHILEALKYQPYNHEYCRDTQFYFEYAAPLIEGWMTFPELTWLYTRAKEMNNILELGSWKGRSTHALLSGCKGIVEATDTWEGSVDVRDDTNWMAKREDIFETFKKNVGHFKNLGINRKKGMDAAVLWSDKNFDMVFIDAGHTYEEVKEDIAAWLPKAKLLICGHDYMPSWMGVIQAVDEAFGKPDGVEDTIWYKWIGPKVSFIIPTMNKRPEGLKKCIDSIKALNYPQALIEIVQLDGPGTVPEKVKRGVAATTGEYIVYAADDMSFDPDSLRKAITLAERGYDLVAFHGGDIAPDEGNICEHFMIKRSFIPKLENGEVFSTDFHHVGCDNWLWAQAVKQNQATHCLEAKIDHKHFSKGAFIDETYEKAWSHVDEDRAILRKKLASL